MPVVQTFQMKVAIHSASGSATFLYERVAGGIGTTSGVGNTSGCWLADSYGRVAACGGAYWMELRSKGGVITRSTLDENCEAATARSTKTPKGVIGPSGLEAGSSSGGGPEDAPSWG